jgi:putative ABC transport system substrate-binding protein
MRRRDFIAGTASAAAWPLVARGQQPERLKTIGYLGGTTPTNDAANTAAWVQRLRELGWIEGRNVTIAYRWVEARTDRSAEIAAIAAELAEFVRMKVDVIHVGGTDTVLLAKRATSVIPIVFAVAGDPVELGIVASLARPGGNATGLTNQLTELAGKRLELLREIVPRLRRIAMMDVVGSLGAGSLSDLETKEVQAAANTLGLDFVRLEIRQKDDIAIAFNGLKDRADALYVANRSFLATNGMRITTLALVARLPTVFATRRWLDAGGMLSYGVNFPVLFRRSAEYVDKVLRGTKPADIPVEQPTKFDLAINLVTAQAIGLTIPPGILAIADEVIE